MYNHLKYKIQNLSFYDLNIFKYILYIYVFWMVIHVYILINVFNINLHYTRYSLHNILTDRIYISF